MSTETIDIVVRESGSTQAAANIEKIGAASEVSDKELAGLLQRAGSTSAAMGSLISTTGTSIRSLADLGLGATRTGAALQTAGTQATSAATGIGSVAEAATASGAGLRAMQASATPAAASLAVVGTESRATAVQMAALTVESNATAAGMAKAGAASVAAGAEIKTAGAAGASAKEQFGLLQASLGALGLAFGVKGLVDISERYQNLTNKLSLASTSTEDFVSKQQAVFDIAQASRQPLDAIGGLYAGLVKGSRNYAVSAQDVVDITKVLAQSATIAGKDMGDQSQALKGLGLALLKGELDGRPFMSLIREMPGLITKVAPLIGQQFAGPQGMGKFIEAAQNGGISMQKFLDALKQLGPSIEGTFKRVEVTVGGAFTQLGNAVEDFIGRSDQGTGATRRLAEGIQALVPYVPIIVQSTIALTAALTAYGIAAIAARVATISFVTSFAGIAALLAGAVAAIYFFGDAIKLNSEGTVTLVGAMVGAFRTLVDVFQQLYTWATTTAEGFVVVGAGMTVLIGLAVRFIALALWESIAKVATAFLAWLPTILGVVGAFALLVAAVLAVRFAWTAWTKGLDAAQAELSQTKQNVLDLAASIKDKFTKNVTDATTQMKGGLGALKPEIQGVGSEFSNAGISIVRAGQGASGAIKSLAGDSDASTARVVNGFSGVSAAIRSVGDTAKVTSSTYVGALKILDDANTNTENSINSLKNSATQDFAAITSSAQAMAAAVAASSSQAAGAIRASQTAQSYGSSISRAGSTAPGSGLGDYPASAGYGSAPSITPDSLANSGYNTAIYPSPIYSGDNYGTTPTDLAFATGGSFVVGGNGGTDSQMVRFMATPGERVSVETPAQAKSKKAGGGAGGSPIIVKMTVNAKDANSFRLSETQILTEFQNKLRRVQSQLGGN